MPYTELLKWITFFHRRPVGWREDQRTFLLLKAQGYKGKGEDLFTTLRLIKEANENIDNHNVVPRGKFLSRMLTAVGGDSSGWKPTWS